MNLQIVQQTGYGGHMTVQIKVQASSQNVSQNGVEADVNKLDGNHPSSQISCHYSCTPFDPLFYSPYIQLSLSLWVSLPAVSSPQPDE